MKMGTKQWRYYDFGPKVVPPLICFPGVAGTADVYYKQIMSLSMKGYRVISVDIPRVWNRHEWIQAFEKFLDVIDVHHIHIYGTSLGGFLAQAFAQHRPRQVRSLILSNTFLETHSFAAAMPWAPVEILSREAMASRLTLNVDAASVGSLLLSDSYITIMDTNDYCAIPQQVKDQLSERYPEARKAYLKTGGNFPFLSRPDERVGVEARPDWVRSIPKDGTGGSHSEEEKKEDPDDQPKDGGSSESQSEENQLPPVSESSESHTVENQLLRNANRNAKCCLIGEEDISHLWESLKKQHIITTENLLLSTCESFIRFLLLYVQSLYITTKLLSETWATGVK
ncbi:hypothetical protein P3X46_016587 [Hevea brasiliensis]|uniref:Maspardin n=1 Tax=Hevea brasiliensis TaxID=3981 RepID=A0ABQ9LZN7_HEVBR|nr:hypothetical protein P3X46_016587 [Hevea brasiliensis]